MSLTYTAGGGPRDDIRLFIGDTDPNAAEDARLEDADIDRLITLYGGLRYAAAGAARALAAKFLRKFEGGSGPGPSRTRAQELNALAAQLEKSAAAVALPFAGGLRQSEKTTAAADTDRVQPAFRRGLLDHPESG